MVPSLEELPIRTTKLEEKKRTICPAGKRDFEYNTIETSSTPAHQVVKGEVSFNISNPALLSLQSTSGCIAQSYKFPNYFYDSDVYHCVDPDSDSKTKTAFTFDSASGLLSINQSWTCPDTTETMSFIASGAVNLTLTTTPTVYSNPNWHVGETFHNSSKYSTAVDGPIMAFQVDRVA
ncbi:hypothetical protein CMQ_3241 [Grosmannia clavigera kw1407]|uniref:AA1-like domain-containing protein n=1 Tax=Grosmannia clavigera (strain kw1407 / UAMH 11150) TaxID=655863 RepID=F0XH80_GROCL|nr:uncharacterized protein CMQ_3241 [Grosmannia clavigera kw1407]EFX03312.1 hypothetical protein CMQ_3241 [Grosmannia clavigera kw1407]